MILTIKVKPGAKIEGIEVDLEGMVHVRIRERAVNGKANKYLMSFLAEFFDVPKSKVLLISGHTAPIKRVEIPLDKDIVEMTLALFKK